MNRKLFLSMATGYPTLDDRATLKTIYDAKGITEAFLKDRDLSGSLSEYWTPLSNNLVQQFAQCLAKYPISQWPSALDRPDNALFQLEVVHYDQKAKQMTLANIVLLYRPQLGGPWMEVHKSEASFDQLRDSEPITFGNTSAYQELKDGRDARFSQWRENKWIKNLLGRHKPASEFRSETRWHFVVK